MFVATQQQQHESVTPEFQALRAFSSQAWYPDSGASHDHLTADSHNLTQSTQLNGSNQVMIGNGQAQSLC